MHIVILGNGISGITAARHIRQHSDNEITVVSAESDHFFSRTDLMYLYMGKKKIKDIKPFPDKFWKENRIDLINGLVTHADLVRKTLHLNDDTSLSFDKLIIAVGSRPNKAGWPGQDLDGVHGLYSLQDLDAMERHSKGLKRAVIVGGGLLGVEMAEMFHSRKIPVTFLVRESSYYDMVLPSEESALVTRRIREQGIDLRLETELREIWGDRSGKVKMVFTSKGEKIECGYVGITTGIRPNIDFLHFTPLKYERGILVNENLETSIPGVYAVGSCAQMRDPKPGREAIETRWLAGGNMGETAAHNILASSAQQPPIPYDPGIWFHSAKFFGISYQACGEAGTGQDNLYWEHPDGHKSIRIAFHPDQGKVAGFIFMGLSFSREICEKWILEGVHIEEVLLKLRSVETDGSFSRKHESAMIQLYNAQTGKNLREAPRSGLAKAFGFLK